MRTLFVLGVVFLVLLALPAAGVLAADLLGGGADLNAWLEAHAAVSHRVAVTLPAAAALLLVPPAIVLLYFLRLKRTSVPVSSTYLWKKSVEDLHVNRLMQWLRRNFLLLLQVFAALMLVYGVLGPRLHGAVLGGRHYILVIDNSASMTATDVAPTRLAWAKAEALKEIDAAADSDTGMVIAFSDAAEIRQSYTGNRGELRAAVNAVQPTQRPTKIDEALNLAASLANPARSTENEAAAPADPEPGKARTYVAAEGIPADVHLYSDGQFPPPADFALANLNLAYHVPPVPAGEVNNVAVLRFDAERDAADPTTVVARAVVRNFKSTPADVRPRLEVLAGGTRLVASYDDDESRRAKQRTPVPPRAERPDVTFTVPDVPEGADLVFKLKLDGNADALPLDDEAWVCLGVVRKARVLVVGPDNRPVRYVLDAPSLKRLADVAYLPASALTDPDPKAYAGPARDGKYDLVIYDRCGPAAADLMPAANTLFVGFPPPPFTRGDKPGPNVATPAISPAVRGWSNRHPVMRHLQALDEIDVATAFRLPELPARSHRLIEGTDNLVLLAAVPRRAYTDLVLTFPILTDDGRYNTNWPLKVSFPLFLRSVVVALGNVRDASTEEPVKPGRVKSLRLGGVPAVSLSPPAGPAVTLERGSRPDFLVAGTDQVGLYTARWTDPAGAPGVRRFAVNLFDPAESDLAVKPEVKIGNATVAADAPRKQPRDLWKLPVLLGFIALAAEWWVYNRRVQI